MAYTKLLLLISFLIGIIQSKSLLLNSLEALPNPGINGFYEQKSGQTFYWRYSNESHTFPPVCDDVKAVLCIGNFNYLGCIK